MALSPSGQITRDWYLDAARGLIDGAIPTYILGLNPSITSVPADVWSGGGLYPWMSGATALEIVSSSASDAAAGTGARTVTLNGLDIDYAEVAQVLALNGTAPVAIPTSLFRINSMPITTVGSGGVNAGTLTVRDSGAGATRALMDAGIGMLRQSQFTVPAGKTLLISKALHSINRPSSIRDATVSFFFRQANGAYSLLFDVSVDGQPVIIPIDPISTIPEKSDIGARVTYVSQSATIFNSAFFGVLIDNSKL